MGARTQLDGYRAQASFNDGRATVYSRRGNDWTARFGSIGAALQHLPANGFVIDGEVVVPDDEGRPNFGWLQDDLAEGRTNRMLYYAFDLLWLDGFDIGAAPLVDRKRVLAELLAKPPHPIVYSEHFEIEGAALFSASFFEPLKLVRQPSTRRCAQTDTASPLVRSD